MPSDSFDITGLLQLRPPRMFCEKCCALLRDLKIDWKATRIACPTCHVEYIGGSTYKAYDVYRYLKDSGYAIEYSNLLAHCQALARIALRSKRYMSSPDLKPYDSLSPMGAVLAALQEAQQFIHFTSFGIDDLLVGAIKMAAQRVKVRGIVSNVGPKIVEEFTKYSDDAPHLEVKLFERDNNPRTWEIAPHQKLIVIDGLFAFSGGANLTTNGLRKAAIGRDHVDVVTNVDEVISLHNRLFSPIWAEFNKIEEFTMDDVPF